MVRDGVVVVLPLYLLVLVLEFMAVMEPPIFLCHCGEDKVKPQQVL
jgi:hypothetical protein